MALGPVARGAVGSYIGCRASAACLAVSTLVAAVEQMHKAGDEERRQAAQRILDRSLQLTCAIENQLAKSSASPQLDAPCSQANIRLQAAPAVGFTGPTCTVAPGPKRQDVAACASVDVLGLAAMANPSDWNGAQLWTFDGCKDLQQQLPSHCQLVKVSARPGPVVMQLAAACC